MTRLFMGYNGVKVKGALDWITKRYKEQDKAVYISYRLGRTKIDLVHGEWLKDHYLLLLQLSIQRLCQRKWLLMIGWLVRC